MSVKLAILGILMEGDMHPYQIRQTMIERFMGHYIKMRDGSLYYAVEQLAKDGHIVVKQVVRDEARPERTIYSITESGRSLFQRLLLAQFQEKTQLFNPMYAALSFARHGDPELYAPILQEKISCLEQNVQDLTQLYEEHIPTVSRSVLHMLMGMLEHNRTELNWMKRLYADAKAGRLKERGRPLDLD